MSGPGAKALEEIDAVLAAKPHKDDYALTRAAEQLCILRDALIARRNRPDRTHDDARRLNHVNAVISVVLAMHFPLGEVPWDELAKARAWLAKMVDEPA